MPESAAPWFVAGVEHGRAEATRKVAQQLRAAKRTYQEQIAEAARAQVKGKRAKAKQLAAVMAPWLAIFDQLADSFDVEGEARETAATGAIEAARKAAPRGVLAEVGSRLVAASAVVQKLKG